MALRWPSKDPDEVLDYQLDWTARLDGDTISSSSWAVASGSGLTIDSDSETTTLTTVWLSAGTEGTTYTLTNTIVTAASRTMEQSVRIRIKEK